MIDRKQFQAWLTKQAKAEREFGPIPHWEDGQLSWVCGCPLAIFCREVLGIENAVWAGLTLRTPNSRPQIFAGKWALEFTRLVDQSKNPISAYDALQCLLVVRP